MTKQIKYTSLLTFIILAFLTGCGIPPATTRKADTATPGNFPGVTDTASIADISWREYFNDPYLATLIDSALVNNQELNIIAQEITISKSEVRARKGEYLPFLDFLGGAGVEKVGRYTSQGANDANTEIAPGRDFPEPLGDFTFGLVASWELDIWKKLRNAKKAAALRYLSSIEGKNFMVTALVAEISSSYYELQILDSQLEVLRNNIAIQENALEIIRLEKQSARVTELAVQKFEAEVFKNKSLQFQIKQEIVETENRINFLVGRFPQPVQRSQITPELVFPDSLQSGIPSQLLQNRPDIRQAELDLAAADLDVKVARANFYPSVSLTGGVGFQAFNPAFLIKAPESLLFSLAGDLVAPLVNRNAIQATYSAANAKQVQLVFTYEQTILKAYTEVVNEMTRMDNLKKSYDLQTRQIQALNNSIRISTNLFRSAKADYMEVLLTQRDALEAKMERLETTRAQMLNRVQLYRSLGGGWE